MRNTSERPRWKKVLSGTLYGLFLFALFAGGTAAGWIKKSPLLSTMAINLIAPKDPKTVFHGNSVTLLILGCDQDVLGTYSYGFRKNLARKFLETGERPHVSRAVDRSKARTDMILVAKLDFDAHTISGVSIPRDVECQLPGYKNKKINAYYSIAPAGEEKELAKRAVEFTLPGVKIDKVVTLDYDEFQKVVDLVGGVPLDVSKDMQYVDAAGGLFINLKKGHQTLDGYDAMGFVRIRKLDSDFERQKRQKDFMVSLKQQIMSPRNITSLPAILEQTKEVLGGGLDNDEIASLATFAKTVPPDHIKLGMIPIEEMRGTTDLRVDQRKLPEVLGEFGLLPGYVARGTETAH
ncbi:hypothetical protein BH11ARM1_BH11ARM1_00370 [soil metagenome]